MKLVSSHLANSTIETMTTYVPILLMMSCQFLSSFLVLLTWGSNTIDATAIVDRMPVILGSKESTEMWLNASASSNFDSILKPYNETDLVRVLMQSFYWCYYVTKLYMYLNFKYTYVGMVSSNTCNGETFF